MLYHRARPPLGRFLKIDAALRARGWPNTRTLASELEVDRRTIRRDIDYMRDQLHAPIAFDGAHRGYYYTEPTFRLAFPQLTQGELLALYLSEQTARHFRGTPFERDLRQAIAKLGEMLPDHVSVRVDTIADSLSVLPAIHVHYDAVTFSAVLSAVSGRRRLEIVYWTASRNETTKRLFDPYEVSLVDDGWYAFGHCHRTEKVRMFAIQRVRSARETGDTFDRPAGFRVDEFLQGSFRAMPGEGAHDVVLRFGPLAAGRVREKRWHASQVLEDQPDGSLIVRMQLSGLIEIKRWIMWWGIECEVLEPEELRALIATELREMLDRSISDGMRLPPAGIGSARGRTRRRG